ncbi:mas-related G-protein coupled receptor member B8-like [Desmodus rotundus]|uniref:mas-related G-protein coupled receptor member B8-like n=1 Tax=Desmodus rotundus TaxID=9430 RepID=UPI00238103AA|nr:mas-related G-protein coupled receptor member B8-like [Desmodus rotundus]
MENYSTYEDNYYNFYPETTQVLKVIAPLGILICLVGLVGNGLVLGLLGFSVKWGDFTVFIFHLSLADFLYLSCQTVLFIQIILAAFHDIWFDVSYVLGLTDISYTVGLWLLTAISVTHCLSVLRPIWCRLHAPRHAPAVVCALIWVSSVSVNVHRFLVCRVDAFHNWRSCDMYTLVFPVCSCVLFSVTVMCILIVLFKVRSRAELHPHLKLYITVLLTVLFLLFAFPLDIYVFFLRYTEVFYLPNILLLLTCVNSSTHPLVYYFVGRIGGPRCGENLREVFQKALGEESALRRDSSAEEEGHSQPSEVA